MNNDRHRAASLARSYLEKRIPWQQFMDDTADLKNDGMIDELVDLIEHEPQRGGFMGDWFEYQKAIQSIIVQLEKEEEK